MLDKIEYNQREAIIEKLKQESKGTRGFYLMIALAVVIATLGLVINSSTSIIGGMLVAPFLYPVLAAGSAIIRGNENLFQKSLRTVLFGSLVAVGVATLLTLISPLTDLTSEILARTKPTLIDLLIALASGAAGAYAYTKKEALAALPGVAIAAALVPPLGVVGFAIGSGRFELVTGAFLLYVANLLAIIIASVITFYLLGFTPGRKKEEREEARNDIIISSILFLVVMVILSYFLVSTITDARQTKAVEGAIQTFLMHYNDTEILKTEITESATGKVVTTTLRGPANFTSKALQMLEEELTTNLGEELRLKVILIPAKRLLPR